MASARRLTALGLGAALILSSVPLFASAPALADVTLEAQTVTWNPTNLYAEVSASPFTPNAVATTSGDGAIGYSTVSAGCIVDPVTGVITVSAPAVCVVTAYAAASATYTEASTTATFTFSNPPETCRVTVKGVRGAKKKLPVGKSVVLIRAARANPICQLSFTVATLPKSKSIKVKTNTTTGKVTATAKKRKASVTITAIAGPRPGSGAISAEWSRSWRS